MAEIEITLPTVQYGNVKVKATPEELGVNDVADAYELGVATAVYLNLFQQGFKHGATLDVTAPQGAAQSEVDRVIDETAKAAQILADGLGGATEVDDEAEDARTGSDYTKAPPWDKPAVDAPAKPWEASGGSPAAEW